MDLKKKNITLLIGFIILLWITYQFSISKTIELNNTYKKLIIQKEFVSDITQQISKLKQQNTYYDSILDANKIIAESSFQNNLLKIINSFSSKNQLKIIAFHEPHKIIQKDSKLQTYSFTVRGSFNQILHLLYAFEQYGNYGRMMSINFNKKKNYRTNRSFLDCDVYLQSIEPLKP